MLQTQIKEASLTDAEQMKLRELLIDVGQADGKLNAIEQHFIDMVVPAKDVEPAMIQSLWMHSNVVLSVCVSLAVLNGRYPIEKARIISKIAHQLGYSSKKLRGLEEQVLRMIHQRGKQVPQDFEPSIPKSRQKRMPQSIQDSPYSEALFQLWQSDAELIERTEASIEFDDTVEDK